MARQPSASYLFLCVLKTCIEFFVCTSFVTDKKEHKEDACLFHDCAGPEECEIILLLVMCFGAFWGQQVFTFGDCGPMYT